MNKRIRKKHGITPIYKSRSDIIHKDIKRCCYVGSIPNLFGDGNDADIHVYAGERGALPHFHLDSKDSKIHTSICLQEPAYYAETRGEYRLTKEQMKTLNDHLTDPSPIEGEDLWTNACRAWCYVWPHAKPNSPLSVTVKPNYSSINKIYVNSIGAILLKPL